MHFSGCTAGRGCRARPLTLIGLSFIIAAGARADVVSIGASKDNTLYQDPQGALSNGAGQHLFVGTTGQGLLRRSLIAFDIVGNVPAGSTVNSATLTLTVTQTVSGQTTVTLHRALANWGEGTSHASGNEGGGAPSTPADATWIHSFYDTSFWTNAGGDYEPLESAATVVDALASYTWSSTPMAADVQTWLDSPATNFGWMLRGDEGATGITKRFDSKDSTTASARPVLTIDYTPLPEPNMAIALLAGSLAIFRRR